MFDSWFLVVMPVPVRNCGPDCDPENWNSGLFLSTDRQVIPSSGISELWMLITLILRRAEDFPVSKLILIDLRFLWILGRASARLQSGFRLTVRANWSIVIFFPTQIHCTEYIQTKGKIIVRLGQKNSAFFV